MSLSGAYKVARTEIQELFTYVESLPKDENSINDNIAVSAVGKFSNSCAKIDRAFQDEIKYWNGMISNASWQIGIISAFIFITSFTLLSVSYVQWDPLKRGQEKIAWLLNLSVIGQIVLGILSILLTNSVTSLNYGKNQKNVVESDQTKINRFIVEGSSSPAVMYMLLAIGGNGGPAKKNSSKRVDSLLRELKKTPEFTKGVEKEKGANNDTTKLGNLVSDKEYNDYKKLHSFVNNNFTGGIENYIFNQWSKDFKEIIKKTRERTRRSIELLFVPLQASLTSKTIRQVIERYHRLLASTVSRKSTASDIEKENIFYTNIIPKIKLFIERQKEDEQEFQRIINTSKEDLQLEEDVIINTSNDSWNHENSPHRLTWKKLWSSIDLLILFSFQIYAKALYNDSKFPYPSLGKYMPNVIKDEDVPAVYDELGSEHWDLLKTTYSRLHNNTLPDLIKTSDVKSALNDLVSSLYLQYQPLFTEAILNTPNASLRYAILSPERSKFLIHQRFLTEGSPFGLSMLPENFKLMITESLSETLIVYMEKNVNFRTQYRKTLANDIADLLVKDSQSKNEEPIDLVQAKSLIQRQTDPSRDFTTPISLLISDVQNAVTVKLQQVADSNNKSKIDPEAFEKVINSMSLIELDEYLDANHTLKILDSFYELFSEPIQMNRLSSRNILFDRFSRVQFYKRLSSLMFVVIITVVIRFAVFVYDSDDIFKQKGSDNEIDNRIPVLVIGVLIGAFGLVMLNGTVEKVRIDFEYEKDVMDTGMQLFRNNFRKLDHIIESWKTVKSTDSTRQNVIENISNISRSDKIQLLEAITETIDAYEQCTYINHPSINQVLPFPYLEFTVYVIVALLFFGLAGKAIAMINPLQLVADIKTQVQVKDGSIPAAAAKSVSSSAGNMLNKVVYGTIFVFTVMFLIQSMIKITESTTNYESGLYNKDKEPCTKK